MRIAYLILAHSNPRLIKKVTEILNLGEVAFFIHIDAKASLEPFESIRGDNVFFIKPRVRVYWGEFSQTKAILLLMSEALGDREGYDYFVLLSGSDFPLRSGRYIQRFLSLNEGTEFISMAKLPAPGLSLSRVTTLRFPSSRPLLRFLFRSLAKVGLAQRDYQKPLGGLAPFSGHTWWALSRGACQYVIDFIETHRDLAGFFENTHASDEMIIHTILGNSEFRHRIKRHLVFEDWPLDGPQHHPKMIDQEHLEYFESRMKVIARDNYGPGELLFARKFSDARWALVERVLEMIAKKDGEVAGVSHLEMGPLA